jgi:hypothetical protein
MTYLVITTIAVVAAGLWAAIRVTFVGFGVVSALLAVVLVSWVLLAGNKAETLVVGLGFWLLFNMTYLLGGIFSTALGGRLGHVRSRPISIKDANSH